MQSCGARVKMKTKMELTLGLGWYQIRPARQGSDPAGARATRSDVVRKHQRSQTRGTAEESQTQSGTVTKRMACDGGQVGA